MIKMKKMEERKKNCCLFYFIYFCLFVEYLQQIGDLLINLRENPEYLSYAMAVQFELRSDKKVGDLSSIIVCALYRNAFSPREERFFLKFLLVCFDKKIE
jgi:hypothetical protein